MEKRGERLRAILKEREMSVYDLSRLTGIGQSTLQSMITNNFKNSSVDRVISIAQALDIKVHDFIPEAKPIQHSVGIGKTFAMAKLIEKPKSTDDKYKLYEETSRAASMKEVEYYGQISAGERASVLCESKNEIIELPKFIFGRHADRKDIFVVKAFGDSMNKIIPNGSFVICAPVNNHNELKDGDIVVYTYENESSMKRYREKGNHIVFSPESDSHDFFDFVVSRETINNVKIDAKVIAYHVILE